LAEHGETANTPLELYEAAYRLHYNENRPSDALKYYDAIIREFPNSNECGYAVIQINKIKANEVSASITVRKKGGALAAISFFLCLLIIAAMGAGAYLANEYVLPEAEKIERRGVIATRALGKILNGQNEEALLLLDEMKELSDSDITPYELSAQIYRNAGLMERARAEYETFFAINPRMKTKTIEELLPDLPPERAGRKR
jgi:tetratricopeptide (TPR) repeat protein